MKKIILVCVAVFVFSASVVNVVLFSGKNEYKAHLTLNNIIALAQNGENWWEPVAWCECDNESVDITTRNFDDGGYVKETRYYCNGDWWHSGGVGFVHPSDCRYGSKYEHKEWSEALGKFIEYTINDSYTYPYCLFHTEDDHIYYR